MLAACSMASYGVQADSLKTLNLTDSVKTRQQKILEEMEKQEKFFLSSNVRELPADLQQGGTVRDYRNGEFAKQAAQTVLGYEYIQRTPHYPFVDIPDAEKSLAPEVNDKQYSDLIEMYSNQSVFKKKKAISKANKLLASYPSTWTWAKGKVFHFPVKIWGYTEFNFDTMTKSVSLGESFCSDDVAYLPQIRRLNFNMTGQDHKIIKHDDALQIKWPMPVSARLKEKSHTVERTKCLFDVHFDSEEAAERFDTISADYQTTAFAVAELTGGGSGEKPIMVVKDIYFAYIPEGGKVGDPMTYFGRVVGDVSYPITTSDLDLEMAYLLARFKGYDKDNEPFNYQEIANSWKPNTFSYKHDRAVKFDKNTGTFQVIESFPVAGHSETGYALSLFKVYLVNNRYALLQRTFQTPSSRSAPKEQLLVRGEDASADIADYKHFELGGYDGRYKDTQFEEWKQLALKSQKKQ